MDILTLDVETEAIVNGAAKNPKIVGVALKEDDQDGYYLSWGHPTNNNCTFEEAKKHLQDTIPMAKGVLNHNAKYDARCILETFGINYLGVVHDTLFLAYINDPREKSLRLKDLADKYLNMPPDEQEELRDWLVANVKKATAKNFGAHISLAPGDLVGRYAVGDVTRTYGLYQYFKKELGV